MADEGTIFVKGKGNDHKVVLFEKNQLHPGGEAFVVNDGKVYEVARTPMVRTRIGTGTLIHVDSAQPAAEEGKEKPPPNTPPLPWVGYDKQKPEEIIDQLDDVDEEALSQVLAYEKAKGGRARKSIIEKVESLSA